MLTVICPNCKQTLRVPERFAGQTGACKKCGGRIIIPPMAIPVHDGEPPSDSRTRNEIENEPGPVLSAAASLPDRNQSQRGPIVASSPAKKDAHPSLFSYIVAAILLLAFFVVIYFYGVFPRAGNLSKALNLGLPVIGLVLLVVLAVLIGVYVKRVVHAKDEVGAGAMSPGSWLIWGAKDDLECPYCGAPADLDLLVDLFGESGTIPAAADPCRTRRYTCGDCGAQFPFRAGAGAATWGVSGNGGGRAVYEWQPQRIKPRERRVH